MAQTDNALTTLDRAKSFLGITGTSKDIVITMLVLGVSKAIEDYCNRKFGYGVHTDEVYSGRGVNKLWLKGSPIKSGQTLSLSKRTENNSSAGWEGIDSEDFYIDYASGMLTAAIGAFDTGVQNYKVTYTGGYRLPSYVGYQDGTDDDDDLPADLELAALDLVKIQYSAREQGNIVKQKVNDVEIQYATGGTRQTIQENPHIKAILDHYRVPSYG